MDETNSKWFLGCYDCNIYVGPLTISEVNKAQVEHRTYSLGHLNMPNYAEESHFTGRRFNKVELSEFVKKRG